MKEPGKGLGIRIADQMSEGGSQVVVAEVLKGGAADMDGKLKKGRYSGCCCVAQVMVVLLVCFRRRVAVSGWTESGGDGSPGGCGTASKGT